MDVPMYDPQHGVAFAQFREHQQNFFEIVQSVVRHYASAGHIANEVLLKCRRKYKDARLRAELESTPALDASASAFNSRFHNPSFLKAIGADAWKESKTYLNRFDIQPTSIDELKVIYWTGRAIKKHAVERSDKILADVANLYLLNQALADITGQQLEPDMFGKLVQAADTFQLDEFYGSYGVYSIFQNVVQYYLKQNKRGFTASPA